jgi:hypothetical protein
MSNLRYPHRFFSSRNLILLLLLSSVISTTSCSLFGTHKSVQVPQLLTPLVDADKTQLFAEINRMAALKSIHGKVDLTFEDNSFAESGIAEKYKRADATITLQRPGQVYLVIQVPFIAKDIAQMTSDGEHFRVAVLQGEEKYKRFVKGTNNAVYKQLDLNGADAVNKPDNKKRTMSEKETVSALSNLRPQHLTDALMIRPVSLDTTDVSYAQSEFYQEEADTRATAKKGARVIRGYYVLEEMSHNGAEAKLLRRFWFDRVSGVRLARLQTFDDRGLLLTDVSYFDSQPFGEAGTQRLPVRVEITRPHDRYKLSIAYQAPGSVVLDKTYQPEAFILENKWQLPEVDLDARQTSNR